MKLKQKGFTLVEIMIVVAIITILSAVAIPNFMTARTKSRANTCKANLRLIESTIVQYSMDNKLSNGTDCTFTVLVPTYLKRIPVCQSGGRYGDSSSLFAWTPDLFRIDGTPWCSIGNTKACDGYPHVLLQ